MRNLILFTLLICCRGQITKAQVRVTDFTEPDLKGHVKRVVEYIYRGGQDVDTSGSPQKVIKDFDEKGNQLDEITYGGNGKMQDKCLFEYPNDNTVIKNQYYQGHKLAGKYTFKYDKIGNEIEFDTFSDFDPRFKTELKIFYKYDDARNRIGETSLIDPKNITQKVTSKYNAEHQEIEQDRIEYHFNVATNEKIIYTYDSFGRKIKSETFDLNGNSMGEHNISYSNIDAQENWLMEVYEINEHSQTQGTFVNKHITKRQITYFE